MSRKKTSSDAMRDVASDTGKVAAGTGAGFVLGGPPGALAVGGITALACGIGRWLEGSDDEDK